MAKNHEVTVTPFPQKVQGIISSGYFFPMGRATRKVVSEADADLLERESLREIKNARTQKMETRSRFSFTRIQETDKPVDKKLENRRGLAEVPPLVVPHEQLNDALLKNMLETQKVLNQLPELIKTVASRK